MALEHNNFTSQEDFAREARILVYTYEKYPSKEKRQEDRDRYPSVYKLFNNRPSFGDASAGAHMSRTPEIIHLKAHPDDTGRVNHRSISPHPDARIQTHLPSQHHVITHPNAYPMAAKSVNYCDAGRVSPSPLDKGKLIGNKSQTPVPCQHYIVTHPKGSSQTVEFVKYGDTCRGNQSPRSPQPHLGGCEKEMGHDDKKHEGDLGEEQCVDAAAAGFIEWKLRTLKLCMA